MVKLDSRQVGKCGELLVQYTLLKYGVESAPLTTDAGIDLIAYSSIGRKPVTIQVKTSTHHGSSSDKWLEWEVPEDCPADYIALADMERDKFWFFRTEDFKQRASHAGEVNLRLWWSLPGYESKRSEHKEEQFREYEMGGAIPKVFGAK